jgi:hypothetical protein
MKLTGKLGILLAALALASCDFMTPLPEPVLNLSEFDYYVFASQDMLTDDISATSRATVNVHTGSRPFEDGIIENYPEVGQTTDYYVIPLGSNLYQITAITTYPDESSIRDTIEEYRVLDTGDIGTWEASDPIVNDSNVQDNKYRFNFYTRLRDFTTRTEQILEDKHEDNVNYKILMISAILVYLTAKLSFWLLTLNGHPRWGTIWPSPFGATPTSGAAGTRKD